MVGARVEHANNCQAALNGEFAVGGDNMGHSGDMSGGAFGEDPQKRIDFAYRGNHATALVAKALIKTFYGEGPRFSYFVGCSDGGREALMEAERFPTDFDGVAAGDPAAMFTVQNSFFHLWNALSDKRADASNILMPAKQKLLHDAVIAQCDTLSSVKDGLLQDPSACRFDPAELLCKAGATETSRCLTAEELGVAQAQYGGATDGKGHYFSFGIQKGTEALWTLSLPTSQTGDSMSFGLAATAVRYLLQPTVNANEDLSHFQFTEENFARMIEFSPLYDALNTNLKPFAAHGGKLILYHGLSDAGITPGVSIAYFEGVQKYMGEVETDRFMRLFTIPGMGHCRGGDGYSEFDILSPLMAWTELQKAPAYLLTGKTATADVGAGVPNGPVASAAPAYLATRPVYPYPYVSRYTGKGDPKDAANYKPVKSPAGEVIFPSNNEALKLIGPNNQRNYKVVNHQLVEE